MSQASQSKIVVIGVNYQTDAMALRFVRSLSAIIRDADVAIVLVDNSERADSYEFFNQVHAENSEVLCLKPSTNLGYFKGADFGLKEHLKSGQDYDWVIVSNVDVEFKNDDFFTHLKDMEQLENVGVVAPSIWSNLSRRDQNPKIVTRPSKFKMKFYKLMFSNFYSLNFYVSLAALKHTVKYIVKDKLLAPAVSLIPARSSRQAFNTVPAENGLRYIYAPQGTCIIFAKHFFLRGGSLDFPMFLFYEEVYVAETARKLGLHVIYNPRLILSHDEHQSTGLNSIIYSREAATHIQKSAVYIVDTYFT